MPIDPGLDARVQAVAHLSAARALVECADCALEEAGVPTPEWSPQEPGLTLSSDAIYHLNTMADALMEPYEIARVLDTVEEVVAANGLTALPSAPSRSGRYISRHGRAAIVHALIDARADARQDEVA
jgi:hypothetical protein